MPRFTLVKELLDGGQLGDLRSASVRNQRIADPSDAELPWRVRPEISGGGHFVDLGSHTLDVLDWLLGPITSCSGVAVNRGGHYRAEDLVTAVFSLASGVEGVGLWNYDAAESADEVEIAGTTGSVRFSSFGAEPLRLRTPAGERQIEAPYPETVQLPLIQTVVDALTGRGESPSTGRTGLRTARVIDAILTDYRRDHRITY